MGKKSGYTSGHEKYCTALNVLEKMRSRISGTEITLPQIVVIGEYSFLFLFFFSFFLIFFLNIWLERMNL